MVILNRIYTRTGDDGTCVLGSGERCSKNSHRIEVLGSLDETNAFIGLSRSALREHGFTNSLLQEQAEWIDAYLAKTQNDLFDIGGALCFPPHAASVPTNIVSLPAISRDQILWLEKGIDHLNTLLLPLTSFILPGGSEIASRLHCSRTICRRTERSLVALHEQEAKTIDPNILAYINRLSDFLFVAARIMNNGGKNDVLWVPHQNESP